MILYGDVLKFATLFMNDDVLSSICEVLGNQQSCEEWLVAKEAQGICKLRSDSSTWHHMAPIASAAQDVWSHLICTAISEEHPYKRVSNGSNEDTPTRSQWVKEL